MTDLGGETSMKDKDFESESFYEIACVLEHRKAWVD